MTEELDILNTNIFKDLDYTKSYISEQSAILDLLSSREIIIVVTTIFCTLILDRLILKRA
jgi:hypothetical protein